MKHLRLSEITAALESGARPKGGVTGDGDVPSLGGEHLTDLGGFRFENIKRIPKSFFDSMRGGRIQPHDILIVKDGATTGRTCYVPEGFPYANAAINEHVFRLQVDKTVAVPRYVFHFLFSPKGRAQILSDFRGATVGGISRKFIEGVDVPLPPLDEQRRIAAILDQLDSLRSMRLNVITALDDLVRSLFSEASGAVPAAVMPLPDAYWFQEGPGIRKWQFTDTGVKLLNVGNITVDGRLDLSKTERHVSADEANGRYKHFLVDPGDLVIASSGISFDADGLLRTRGAFVDEADLPLCMNTSTIRFKAKTGLSDLTYLRSWLNSAEFRSQISRLVTGSAQQNFGPSHLKQMQITLPPVAIQERFSQQVGAIERHRTRCLEMLAQSDQMTASIQSDAFAGSI